MIIVFWGVAAVLIVIALLIFARSAFGLGKRAATATRSEVNLSVYRDQLRELDAELAAGTLDETQYRSAKNDLESRMLEDSVSAEPTVPKQPAGNRALIIGVAIAVPILAVALYFVLGNPSGLEPQQAAAPQVGGAEHAVTQEQIEAMVSKLAKRLESRPDDTEGWVMLARSYTALQRYAEASQAYARLAKLLPGDARLLADYADVLAMSKKTLQGEPEKIILQALKIEPANIKALSLAGSAAFERKDYRLAVKWWEKILALMPPDSQDSASVVDNVNEARGLAGLPPLGPQANKAATRPGVVGGSVSGTASLDPALQARVAPTDSVFIFARAAEGPRMPLAVIRKTVQDLPLTFTLDDSMAVMPSMNLSSVDRIVVGVRVSKTGNASPSPGDLEGLSKPVKIGSKGIAITIDSEVK